MNFDEVYTALVDQYDKSIITQTYPLLKLTGATSPTNQSGESGQGNLNLNVNENAELNEHLPKVKQYQTYAFASRQIAPVFSLFPDVSTNFQFWGVGGTITLGGRALTQNIQTAKPIF